MARLRANDASALDALLEEYWIPLVTYAARLLNNTDAAQDVAQEAFVRIWEQRQDWKLQGSVSALLYKMTRNLALDERKRQSRQNSWIETHRSETPPIATPPEHLQRSQLEATFKRAVADLPDRRREVFLLARVDGLSYRQIGEVLGIAPQTVANHLSAALSDLRNALEPFLEATSRTASL